MHRLAVLDGAAFAARWGHPLVARAGCHPLFDPKGPDAELAAAGGWLIEPGRAVLPPLDVPGDSPLCWLDSVAPAGDLLLHLRQQLDVALPDGRTALLRWYDPRVLATLADVLEPAQWAALCGPIRRWQVHLDGHDLTFENPHAALE
jgi:hypothetical protein